MAYRSSHALRRRGAALAPRRLRRRATTTAAAARSGERRDVSGNVSIVGDLDRRRAEVLPGRHRRVQRAVSEREVKYNSGRRQPADRLVDRGRGRQPARHRDDRPARPHHATSQKQGALKPIDFAKRDDRGRTSAPSWLEARHGRRQALQLRLQGRQQVDRLVQRRRVQGRRRRAAEDVGRPPRRPQTRCKASGVPPYSIGGADGWTLTDLFENIYLRQAGPDKYDQLTDARDPVDRPVGQGRAHDDGEGRSATRRTSPAARAARCRPTSRPR